MASSTLKRGGAGILPSAQPSADITDGGAAQIQCGCNSKLEDWMRGWARFAGSRIWHGGYKQDVYLEYSSTSILNSFDGLSSTLAVKISNRDGLAERGVGEGDT